MMYETGVAMRARLRYKAMSVRNVTPDARSHEPKMEIHEMIHTIAERWRKVLGWEKLYEVSSAGRVRSFDRIDAKGRLRRGRVLRFGRLARRYRAVTLCYNGIQDKRYVHELVLEAFVGPRPAGMVCRHLNGYSLDNRDSNLRWGTMLENSNDSRIHGTISHGDRHPASTITESCARRIATALRNGEIHRVIAEREGCSRGIVTKIAGGTHWARVSGVRPR